MIDTDVHLYDCTFHKCTNIPKCCSLGCLAGRYPPRANTAGGVPLATIHVAYLRTMPWQPVESEAAVAAAVATAIGGSTLMTRSLHEDGVANQHLGAMVSDEGGNETDVRLRVSHLSFFICCITRPLFFFLFFLIFF